MPSPPSSTRMATSSRSSFHCPLFASESMWPPFPYNLMDAEERFEVLIPRVERNITSMLYMPSAGTATLYQLPFASTDCGAYTRCACKSNMQTMVMLKSTSFLKIVLGRSKEVYFSDDTN